MRIERFNSAPALSCAMHEKKNKKRREKMAGINVMNGTVKWFDVRKGYGFISDEDGVDSYVHFTNINMEGFRKLRAGQKVTFVPDEDEHGRAMAREVTVVDDE